MELICSVSLIAKTIGILEDEHEDDSSNSEFGLSDLANLETTVLMCPATCR